MLLDLERTGSPSGDQHIRESEAARESDAQSVNIGFKILLSMFILSRLCLVLAVP